MTGSLAKVLPSVVVGTIAAVFSYDRGLNFSAPAAAAAPARGSPVATWLTGAPVGASFKDFVPPLASALGAQTDWCAPQFEVTLALDRSLVSVAFGTTGSAYLMFPAAWMASHSSSAADALVVRRRRPNMAVERRQ